MTATAAARDLTQIKEHLIVLSVAPANTLLTVAAVSVRNATRIPIRTTVEQRTAKIALQAPRRQSIPHHATTLI